MKKSTLKFKAISIAALVVSYSAAFAQNKFDSKLKGAADSFKSTTVIVADSIMAGILVIGGVFVVAALAQNKPNAKDFVIAWVVAAIFCGIVATIVN